MRIYAMSTLTDIVKNDIKDFLQIQVAETKKEIELYTDIHEIDITVACDEHGTTWNYQTGDNSYTGGAYSLPHWAVSSINEDTSADDLYEDIIGQLEDLLYQ